MALLTAGAAMAQTTITQWNFNSVPPDGNTATGNLSATTGTGTALTQGGTVSAFFSGAGSSDTAATDNSAWSLNGWPTQGTANKTAGAAFVTSTAGFAGITIAFDWRATTSPPRDLQVQYTTNYTGGTTTWIDGPLVTFDTTKVNTFDNAKTVDLSTIISINNNPNFAFRFVAAFDPTTNTGYRGVTAAYATSGNWRLDAVTVKGTATGGGTPPGGNAAGDAVAVCAGNQVTFTVNTVPGTSPASTAITVRANLSALGGSATQLMTESTPGVFTYTHTVPSNLTPGLNLNVPFTITDQVPGRSGSAIAQLTVSDCSRVGDVVISQVYGGSSTTAPATASYNNDYVELFNKSGTAVNITGWSLQYSSSSATPGFFNSQTLQLSGTIAPGKYYLIRLLGDPANTRPAIPTPDAFGNFDMSASSGRVALRALPIPFDTTCAVGDATTSDMVAYGVSTCSEGSAGAPSLSITTAGFRQNNGCVDTGSNQADFFAGTPNPRNSASPFWSCSSVPPVINSASFNVSSGCEGTSVTLTVNVSPGSSPASTGLGVRANLSSLGGSATQLLTPGSGGNYSFTFNVGNVSAGLKTIGIVAFDDQTRQAGTNAFFTAQVCNNRITGLSEPSAVCGETCGDLRLVAFVTVADTPPPSTLTVTADLSALGGSNAQPMFDDGTNGDITAGDNVYAAIVPFPIGLNAPSVSIPLKVVDDSLRTNTSSITLTVLTGCTTASSGVKIDQVYGGGGNSGSTYVNDFIVLHNTSNATISLAGWSVQYASSTGAFNAKTDLTGSIAPGGYYLIQQAAGAGVGLTLDAPDVVGTISMSATDGKVALVNNTTLLGNSCTSPNIVDLVGYGNAASCWEGNGPTVSPSNSRAVMRARTGCQDTNNNNADFNADLATPKNSGTAANDCSALTPCATTCGADYNKDTFLNLDDLGDFITDYYTCPPIPGGAQANAPTYSGQLVGYGQACPDAPDAPAPYAVDAYRTNGFRVGYSSDGSNSCPLGSFNATECPPFFPNLDNLGDYITFYYGSVSTPACGG
jgi:hypothetical protein